MVARFYLKILLSWAICTKFKNIYEKVLIKTHLDCNPYDKRKGEGDQRKGNGYKRNGDCLVHKRGPKDEYPEGGEGKAGNCGEESHGAGQADISTEHGSLQLKYFQVFLVKELFTQKLEAAPPGEQPIIRRPNRSKLV